MKFLKLTFFLVLTSSLITFSSCKNEDDGIPGNGQGCVITWEVGGESFSEEVIGCLYNDETLNVGSIAIDNTQVQVDPVTSPGTYVSELGSGVTAVVFLKLSDGTQIGPKDGAVTVVVDKLSNTEASGTFSGTFVEIMDLTQITEYEVTNGTFQANF